MKDPAFTPDRVGRWLRRQVMARYRADLPEAMKRGGPDGAKTLFDETAVKLTNINRIIQSIK